MFSEFCFTLPKLCSITGKAIADLGPLSTGAALGGVRGSKVFLSARLAFAGMLGTAAATALLAVLMVLVPSLFWPMVWMMSVPAMMASNAILMVSFMWSYACFGWQK